ncbi:hypothetical protein Tco_0940516 [Tanacetum coccineum]|uniref:Reverse transcriptase domain-containing protein n=1 Tax=Tanacetum coccineum TaxID=301880 RepID=A0ABQ5DQV9_9ASTR
MSTQTIRSIAANSDCASNKDGNHEANPNLFHAFLIDLDDFNSMITHNPLVGAIRRTQYTTAFPKILTMSGLAELNLSPPTSTVRNTVRKGNEQISKNLNRPASDAALREYCDKRYHQLLPIIAEKVHQEKMQQEKMKEVKARLNFEGCSRRNLKVQKVSQHSESRTPNVTPPKMGRSEI